MLALLLSRLAVVPDDAVPLVERLPGGVEGQAVSDRSGDPGLTPFQPQLVGCLFASRRGDEEVLPRCFESLLALRRELLGPRRVDGVLDDALGSLPDVVLRLLLESLEQLSPQRLEVELHMTSDRRDDLHRELG